MIAIPKYENKRIDTLMSYGILDTPPEIGFDNLTLMASNVCETPVSFINFIDETRVWAKSKYGLDVTEAPKEIAFCTHLIDHKDGLFLVPDSRKDERFQNNPFVVGNPNIVFYASFPLRNKDGITIGNLCVVDYVPRELSDKQIHSLKTLTDQAMLLTEYRKNVKNNLDLIEKNEELERFAYVAAHDLKAPLNNISAMSSLLSDLYLNKLDEDGTILLNHIKSSSNKLKELIDGILEYSKSPSVLQSTKSNITLSSLQKELISLFNLDDSIRLTIESDINSIYINKSALDQILLNLIENAIKYNNKDLVNITIGIAEDNEKYEFYVQDNGPGIAPDQQEKVFNIFKTLNNKDKYGNTGNGIGLATVKKLIEQMGGEISIKSTEGEQEGSCFIFSINKD